MKTYVAPITDMQTLPWQSSICVSGNSGQNQNHNSVDNPTLNPNDPGYDGPPQG